MPIPQTMQQPAQQATPQPPPMPAPPQQALSAAQPSAGASQPNPFLASAGQTPPVPATEPPLGVPIQQPPASSPAPAAIPAALTGQSSTGASAADDRAQQAIQTSDAWLDTPSEAADADVIEQEWIDKAKEVVAATSDDPYKQVLGLNSVKADYMKKRYDKDIKLPDA